MASFNQKSNLIQINPDLLQDLEDEQASTLTGGGVELKALAPSSFAISETPRFQLREEFQTELSPLRQANKGGVIRGTLLW